MSDVITELVRYRILAAVHMWDLEHGGKKRDWSVIKELAEVDTPVFAMRQSFRKLWKPSDIWFPYPVFLDKDLLDPQKGCTLFGLEVIKNNYEYRVYEMTDIWNQKVYEVFVAANQVEPWAMYTNEVKRFLGFIDDDAAADSYMNVLEEAKQKLSPEKIGNFAAYRQGEEKDKGDFFVRREMSKLIAAFRVVKEPSTLALRIDDGIQSLTDVSYYRRRMYKGESDEPIRLVLSDYELMELFKFVVQHGFDTMSMDSDYWDDFISLLGIENMDGLDARTDFFRVFLPRFELIKMHLAPEVTGEGFSFEDDIVSVYRVIYHSCKENTFVEVLRNVTVMVKYGWLNLDLLGGLGHHYCSFKFVIKVLKFGAFAFDTTKVELVRKRKKLIRDLYDNYRRFKHPSD